MRRILQTRPSPALVVASLALFVSLGGVGYSAVNLPSNSVDSTHLADNAVDSEHLARKAVDSEHLARKAVDSQHLALKAVDSRHLALKAVDSEHLARSAVDSQHLAADAVKAAEIAKNAVTRQGLARNAIVSRIVDNGSLRRQDMAPSAVPTREYAGLLVPNAAGRTVKVGWHTKSLKPPALTYNGPGDYTITFNRGKGSIGCAVPTATPFNAAPETTFRITRLDCTGQQNVIGIATSTGRDTQVTLKISFTS